MVVSYVWKLNEIEMIRGLDFFPLITQKIFCNLQLHGLLGVFVCLFCFLTPVNNVI